MKIRAWTERTGLEVYSGREGDGTFLITNMNRDYGTRSLNHTPLLPDWPREAGPIYVTGALLSTAWERFLARYVAARLRGSLRENP